MTSEEMTTKRTASCREAVMSWSRSTCCDASPSPVSPMTRKAKSPDSTPAGLTAKADAPSRPGHRPDCVDHRLAPNIGARLCPRIPDTGCPVFGIKVPAHAQNGVHGCHDRRDGKTNLEPPAQGFAQGITGTAELDREAEPRRQPAQQDDASPPSRCGRPARSPTSARQHARARV